ncbi:MAG TPA: von Willebrand factor type A domain-containing protein [Vicinamibacterales bacterium]|nr:von Willebrand factor type A domain-containing protein [Vicinamibacterales bacterium]
MRTRIWASVVVVAFVVPLFAQVEFGAINGVVTDSSGAVLAGVTIEITGPETRTVVSDARGTFSFPGLRSGPYELATTLAGFTTIRRTVIVTAGSIERVSIQMSVGALAETITVTGETPVVDAQMTMRASGALNSVAGGIAGAMPAGLIPGVQDRQTGRFNTEAYDNVDENQFRRVDAEPLSTFSIDVDTASYANVRRFLTDGALPPPGAVRIEELINYFRFDYEQPSAGHPFSITTELTACPWNPRHKLALIGLQGRTPGDREPAPRNLVFLIDVSGSMRPADKLPLVRTAMRMLTDILSERDRVAIVVYAGASGLVLPATPGSDRHRIHEALARLEAGGSTNGAQGIQLAYRVARDNFIAGGVNRVVLATDGDFNVGVTNQSELVALIERERESGVFLSVLGVGTGNLKDSTMEKLADKGNGNYSYLDSLHEARKVLVKEAGATLDTIAKDVKIQVEFNPREVAAYRLIGYENRLLQNEDFNDDRKDAGEIGAGHSVTALYEIVPHGVDVATSTVDALRYQRGLQPTRAASSGELLTVKVRYKAPDGDTSQLLSRAVKNRTAGMTANVGFASAVAEFGMVLRESPGRGSASFRAAAERAQRFRGKDEEGYRAEFIQLTERAAGMHDRTERRQSRR